MSQDRTAMFNHAPKQASQASMAVHQELTQGVASINRLLGGVCKEISMQLEQEHTNVATQGAR